MATALEQLESMKCLQENWDGYDAAVPQPDIVDLAKGIAGLIDATLRKSTTGPQSLQVTPTRIGGILIEWEDTAAEHEIDVGPDASLGFLHRDKATGDIVTRMISPFPRQLDFLQELQQLLAA